MPYKHIAAHLKKTELACRLHYHQLSHGSHRRKRTGSISSSNSHGSSSSGSSGSSPRLHYNLGYDHEDDHGLGYSPVRYGANPSNTYSSHKVLLPKPMPLASHGHTDLHGLRIDTAMQPGGSVDTDRLRAIYDQHRSTFWNAIAQEYGPDVSPSQLETIWRSNHPNSMGPPLMRPPTPGDSPDRLGRPSLKPSPLPLYNPYATDHRISLTPLNMHTTGAVSPPERMSFGYGPPTPSSMYSRTPNMSRANTWGSTGYVPQGPAPTAIASLLTENKCPRGNQCTGANCTSGHGHC
jgi:hypothetical protein